jgi:5-formyltetrahydrofolate cyclo-ligase
MTDVRETKESIRKRMRQQRAALQPDWVASRSAQIAERFLGLDAFRQADTVGLYMALPGEVCLDAVTARAWELGKRVVVPAHSEALSAYGFKEMEPDTEVVSGLWGVREPTTKAWAEIGSAACMAVPGVAFSDDGDRIGHGKGYYDRLLADAAADSRHFKVGVCFDFQRIRACPHDAWDVAMDVVVSETSVT